MLHVNAQLVFLEFVTWSGTDKSASNWGLPLTNPQGIHAFSIKYISGVSSTQLHPKSKISTL
jgi:hypothetical protein